MAMSNSAIGLLVMIQSHQTIARARWQDARDVVGEQTSVGTLVVVRLAGVPSAIPHRVPVVRAARLGTTETLSNAGMRSSPKVGTTNACWSTHCNSPLPQSSVAMRINGAPALELCIMARGTFLENLDEATSGLLSK